MISDSFDMLVIITVYMNKVTCKEISVATDTGGNLGSSVNTVNKPRAGQYGIRTWQRQESVFFSKASRPALVSKQAFLQRILERFT